MSVCLVTTLKEAALDTTLLKLGEVIIHIKKTGTAAARGISICHSEPQTITILGDGHFTDSTGASNLGKTLTTSTNLNHYDYVENKDIDILVPAKGLLTSIHQQTASRMDVDDNDFIGMNKVLTLSATHKNLGAVKYMPSVVTMFICNSDMEGDISEIASMNSLQVFTELSTAKFTGDIANFAAMPALKELGNVRADRLTGNINSLGNKTNLTKVNLLYGANLTGNIASLASNTGLKDINLNGASGVNGQLSSLSTLTSLGKLNLSGTNVTGDTSDLAGLTSLTTFTYTNTAITGNWPLV